MRPVLESLANFGIIPVVKIENARHAGALAEALIKANLPCVEITFRTNAAEESIRTVSRDFPEMLVGAGTVLTVEQARRAHRAGTKFIVSPGLSEDVVAFCRRQKVPVIPGVTTATEIQSALKLGLSVLKFFPAEASGGLKTLKTLAAVFGNVKFIPTGGVNRENMMAYLQSDFVAAIGGSWMVKSDLIYAGKFDEITRLAQDAIQKMLGFRLKKMVFCDEQTGEGSAASQFQKVNKNPFFEMFEINRSCRNDQIVIGTNFLQRADFFLKRLGIETAFETSRIEIKNILPERMVVIEKNGDVSS
ncbi:putative KHG/KDPG aldolase [bacterium BMS3Abin05]|nr:putative KHG/KDPG aldolase [bacterium BMS3Abin05]GBE28164.1 putative KHG/KDPG aldolase [bacterium BMS3Bbin03]HDZ12529.1 bifunctional 4-hydroxy-2-oxoglutarate aldolase/2-dehydro-3-deoxy-phosphogluconate aldolase [Bacteroidota bacterium]